MPRTTPNLAIYFVILMLFGLPTWPFGAGASEKFDEDKNNRTEAVKLNNTATDLMAIGKHSEALPLLRQANAIASNLAPEEEIVITIEVNLVDALSNTGNFRSAISRGEKLKQFLSDNGAVRERFEDLYLTLLLNFGGAYARIDPLKAVSIFRDSVILAEAVFGLDSPRTATHLSMLGQSLRASGQFHDAIEVLERAKKIRINNEVEFKKIALSETALALAYGSIGKFEEERKSLRSVIERFKKERISVSPTLASALIHLARSLTLNAQDYEEAEGFLTKAESIYANLYGDGAFQFSKLHVLRAIISEKLGDNESAKRHIDAVIKLNQRFYPDSPLKTLEAYQLLASSYYEAGSLRRAAELQLDAFQVLIDYLKGSEGLSFDEIESFRNGHDTDIHNALYALAGASESNDNPDLLNGALRIVKFAQNSEVSILSRMNMLRETGRSEAFRANLRDLKKLNREYSSAIRSIYHDRKPGRDERENETKKFANLKADFNDVFHRIKGNNEAFSEIFFGSQIDLFELQESLEEDEILISFVETDLRYFVFSVTKNKASLRRVDFASEDVKEFIGKWRRSFDPTQTVMRGQPLPEFDWASAAVIYKIFFEPDVDLTKHKRLHIVPDGALKSVPFSSLVISKSKPANFKDIEWLIESVVISVLPNIDVEIAQSFTNQRKKFLGIGAPELSGTESNSDEQAEMVTYRSKGVVVLEELIALGPLPESEDELKEIASLFGPSNSTIYVGKQATEERIATINLKNYSVIAFATHGLLANEIVGLKEPGLVLGPSVNNMKTYDGLLTTSEIAALKLDADLIILSACNTAGPNGEIGADAYSGLASAFFDAGAKSLMVSHWPVETHSSAFLTTETLGYVFERNIPTADGLRLAQLDMLSGQAGKEKTHPMYWAPYSAIGMTVFSAN